MKTIITISAIMISFILGSSEVLAKTNGKKPFRMQNARIIHGVKSGELTRGEVKQLRRQRKRIKRRARRAAADGHVSKRERRQLRRMHRRASKNIFRKKNNARRPRS